MMSKMATRKKQSSIGLSHREKISRAIKKKWQDAEYREKAMKGMELNRVANHRKSPVRKRKVTKKLSVDANGVTSATPARVRKKKKKTAKKKTKLASSATASIQAVKPVTKTARKKSKKTKKKAEPDGSISRLREERRDLYDLLYGDEGSDGGGRKSSTTSSSTSGGDVGSSFNLDDDDDKDDDFDFSLSSSPSKSSSPFSSLFGANGDNEEDDDNLDNFDPYGLDDF
mmetsp:Transcript_4254/g.5543  ORF Transcript_4254/g.5543 Transcript_4254/m.5543 type:complete len:228 (+) Transcript_4254:468-1151(+)